MNFYNTIDLINIIDFLVQKFKISLKYLLETTILIIIFICFKREVSLRGLFHDGLFSFWPHIVIKLSIKYLWISDNLFVFLAFKILHRT